MTIDVRIIEQETKLAFKVLLADGRRFWWLPKSQIVGGSHFKPGDGNLAMSIPDWLYKEKEQADESG